MNGAEQTILRAVDAAREEILSFARDVGAHPEGGYRETYAAARFARALRDAGYEVTEGLALTGVEGKRTYGPGPRLAVLGEMDAVSCPGHPLANPDTRLAHACGHHQQLAAALGAALALAGVGAADGMADAPEKGVNACAAAALAQCALGMVRDTFRDEDSVRVAAVPGSADCVLNVVPARAELNLQVRASGIPALQGASGAVDRCLRAGALALGAAVEIDTLPGYLPRRFEPRAPWQREIGEMLTSPGEFLCLDAPRKVAISTDVGDLSQVMPVYAFTMGGARGALHSAEYEVTDEETAVLPPAKVLALSAYRLLRHDARALREALSADAGRMSRRAYLHLMADAARRAAIPGERIM